MVFYLGSRLAIDPHAAMSVIFQIPTLQIFPTCVVVKMLMKLLCEVGDDDTETSIEIIWLHRSDKWEGEDGGIWDMWRMRRWL
jgi:hypothetical protein